MPSRKQNSIIDLMLINNELRKYLRDKTVRSVSGISSDYNYLLSKRKSTSRNSKEDKVNEKMNAHK